jgi:hypothetical protein
VTAIEVPEIRRRLRQALDLARHAAAARREQTAAAERDYARFLSGVAEPVFRMFAGALKAEGYPFLIATPSGGLRLESERSREDALEIALDTTETPVVVGRVSRGRGRRMVATERPLRDGAAVAELTEEDVLQFLLTEIVPFVAR